MQSFLYLIVHRLMFARVELVQHDTLGQLHGQPIAVDGNLVHQVAALDAHLLARYQMLNDDVAHVLAKGIPLAVERVHRAKHELVAGNSAVLAADHLMHELWDT